MPIPDEIPQGSVEFFTILLDSPDDLTLGTVQVGLSELVSEQPPDWLPAEWPVDGQNIARTVSPVDTGELTTGFYQVWVKLVDSPEVLPRPYGTVRIV